MNNQIGIGAFGTFGDPHGYQQVFYNGVDFHESLDLDDSAIEFYPGTELFAVRRELVDGIYTICFCVYTYERELNTDRFGTFLGSSVVLQNGFTDAEYIYKSLLAFHRDIISNEKNVSSNIIRVAEAKELTVSEPTEFIAAKANLIHINKTPFFSSGVSADKKFMVLPQPLTTESIENQVITFFDEALKNFSDTGSLYFSFDQNVHDFVIKEGIIPPKTWDSFINEKTLALPPSVVRTKKGIHKSAGSTAPAANEYIPESKPTTTEIQAVATDSTPPVAAQTVSEVPIENKTPIPTPPVAKKEEIQATTSNEKPDYDAIAGDDPYKPFDMWEEDVPQNGWTEEEIKFRVKEYNRLFSYTNSLLEHINEPEQDSSAPLKRGSSKKKRTIMLLIVVAVIVGVTILYQMFSGGDDQQAAVKPVATDNTAVTSAQKATKDKSDADAKDKKVQIAKVPVSEPPVKAATAPPPTPKPAAKAAPETVKATKPTTTPAAQPKPTPPTAAKPAATPAVAPVTSLQEIAARQSALKEAPLYNKAKELHPKPNFELTQHDITALRQADIKGKSLSELTAILFASVPSNIGNIYRDQEIQYAAALLNSNRTAFKKNGRDYFCTAEYHVLRIPAYKSPRLPAVFPK